MVVMDVKLDAIFKVMDVNKDGMISQEEVLSFITCNDDNQCNMKGNELLCVILRTE